MIRCANKIVVSFVFQMTNRDTRANGLASVQRIGLPLLTVALFVMLNTFLFCLGLAYDARKLPSWGRLSESLIVNFNARNAARVRIPMEAYTALDRCMLLEMPTIITLCNRFQIGLMHKPPTGCERRILRSTRVKLLSI